MRYIVTKKSNDGTFLKGDHITFEDDGSILCTEAEGWISIQEVPESILGMICIPDTVWLEKRINNLKSQIKILEKGRLKNG